MSTLLLLPELWTRIHTLHCLLCIYEEWCLIVEQLRIQQKTEILGYPSKAISITQEIFERGFTCVTRIDSLHWYGIRIMMICFGETVSSLGGGDLRQST